jgi:hypothetical protein
MGALVESQTAQIQRRAVHGVYPAAVTSPAAL